MNQKINLFTTIKYITLRAHVIIKKSKSQACINNLHPCVCKSVIYSNMCILSFFNYDSKTKSTTTLHFTLLRTCTQSKILWLLGETWLKTAKLVQPKVQHILTHAVHAKWLTQSRRVFAWNAVALLDNSCFDVTCQAKIS